MNGEAVKDHKAEMHMEENKYNIHLNDSGRPGGNLKCRQLYPVVKRTHAPSFRWILALLTWHHFLL